MVPLEENIWAVVVCVAYIWIWRANCAHISFHSTAVVVWWYNNTCGISVGWFTELVGCAPARSRSIPAQVRSRLLHGTPTTTAASTRTQNNQFMDSMHTTRTESSVSSSGPQREAFLSLLRRTILNRTYGTHKNIYVSLFLLTILGPIYYGPP